MLRTKGGKTAVLGCLIVVTLLVLEALSLWGTAPTEQRNFVETNQDCVRCHGDMIARVSDPSVHMPFKTGDCLTCHTPHGDRSFTVLTLQRISVGGFRAFIDRILFAIISRVVPWHMQPPSLRSVASQATTTTTDPGVLTSDLTQPADRLCWTCHGDMGPSLGDEHVHAPFANGACTSCHDPHSSKVTTLLTAEPSTLCASCHRVGPELEAAVVHQPFGEQRCIECHSPHASNYAGMLIANQRELCTGCHPALKSATTAKTQHQPVAEGDCTGCHKAHSADRTQLLITAAPYLCYRCHEGVQKSFASDTTHPVSCARCHDPHASQYPDLLPSKQRTLCIGCHKNVSKELARSYVHSPAKKGKCTVCHTPHGSDYKALMAGPQSVVCRKCHESKGKPSPQNDLKVASAKNKKAGEARAANWKTSSASAMGVSTMEVEDPWAGRPKGIDPMTTAYTGPVPVGPFSHPESETAAGFECEACHEPHGSEFPGILIADVDQLCTDCHSADTPLYTSSMHAPLKCTDCHVLHDSPDAHLLKDAQPGVCTTAGCHENAGYTAHPVGAGYWDFNANSIMTCTSSCHDPHGSANYVSLRVPYNDQGKGSDYICLICHTEVGITY